MRYAFGHRDETAAKGRAARALMRNKCSPEAVATVVASELRRAYKDQISRGGSRAEDRGGKRRGGESKDLGGGGRGAAAGHQGGRGGGSAEAITAAVASELRRAYYKNHHSGGGVGAGHGVSRGGADGGDDEWVTDIYPGAVFKRDSG